MKKSIILIGFICLMLDLSLKAQKREKIFYDKDWKGCSATKALFYRIVSFDQNGRPIGKVTDFFITGEVQSNIDGAIYIDRQDDSNSKFLGNSISYFKSGKIHFEHLRNKDGIIVYYKSFYENGKKEVEANYKNGEPDGLVTTYYEDGKINFRGEYKNGKPVDLSLLKIEKGCSFYGEQETAEINVRNCTNAKYLSIIDEILSTASLQRNFEVFEANIDNAVATKINSDRLIIIDPDFLQTIENTSKDKFTSYLILAHEIGHHLNAHTEQTKNPSPWWNELEADQFAGSVLQKLGISSSTINSVTDLIAPEYSQSETHPEWQARMKAAINGYCQSFYLETKRNIKVSKNIALSKISLVENQFEQFLNNKIYQKADWERNIIYKVLNGKIYKEYETNYYNGKDQKTFRKEKETIDIIQISKMYLRWHDPGEVAFETSSIKYQSLSSEANSPTVNIETLQSREAAKKLDSQHYYDNEATISDDLNILLRISGFVATIQKYYELAY